MVINNKTTVKMLTLCFQFSGHYHATPWGHQVNEGLVEWPASPWRLIRALLSSGYTHLRWQTELPAMAIEVLSELCGKLPSYYAPPANVAHSRHYMPTARLRSGTQVESTTLVLDTWADPKNEELQVQWDVNLSPEHTLLLSNLVENMNYLGRSESWVEGRVLSESETPKAPNVVPHPQGATLAPGRELVMLMAPVSPNGYAEWRAEQVLADDGSGSKKLTAKQLKERARLEAPYPHDLLGALQWDTSRWRSFGWSQPPGSQLVQYQRPRDALSTTGSARISSHLRHEPADMMLLAIASHSGSSGLLPSIARTLPQAELLHDALIRVGSAHGQEAPAELTGHSNERKPLAGHQHAHILPIDLDDDGHLDHFLLWAKMGFSQPAQEAVSKLRRTFTKGGKESLRIALAGSALQSKTSTWPEGLQKFVGKSRRWVSQTPFVPPRYIKKSGRNSLEGQIRAELASRDLPELVGIKFEVLPRSNSLPERQARQFRHFVRRRLRGGGPPPQDAGWFVELEFPADVTGPICIGYGSHFGLGLFRATDAVCSELAPQEFLE